jgi:altronate dehydratase small subunit
MKALAFQIQPQDNVATMVEDVQEGAIELAGAGQGEVSTGEKILRGHKVAVRDIATEEGIIKSGVRIGHATKPISRGAWVHLHNLASDLDERSGTLDLHSGTPTDMVYE